MEVGLPRSVIFTTCMVGILHKQSVRRTNNDRWGENGGGITTACYLHHVYSRYLAQTVCETDKQWQMRRKWRWDYPVLLSSPRVQLVSCTNSLWDGQTMTDEEKMEVGLPRPVIFTTFTVIRFVWVSAKHGTCTVESVIGTLVAAKMCTFTLESTHFIFNKCPIYTHDGASAKFSTNSHETVYSEGILHKQSVRRTNNDRWGENGGGITPVCYPVLWNRN